MNRRMTIVVLAFALAALLGAQAIAQVKDYRDIKYPALPEFKIPKPTVYTMKNGITVFLVENHELPLINVDARIKTGSLYEPADKAGLASIMGSVQRTGGTAKMSGDEIDDFLAARAANVETGMGDDAGYASMDCLKEDFDDVVKVFSDILRAPQFDQDKIDVAKGQEKAGIARRNDNVNGITSRELRRLVYGADSPTVRMTEYATIAAITRDDLIAWHKKFYHPNNVYLGVVGDFRTNEMKTKLEQTFGNWPKGPDFDPAAPAYRKEPKPGMFFIEKTDVTQANIAMGHIGITVGNPDFFAVQVMNTVLSSFPSGRLFNNIRSKKGLAYNVSGGIGSDYFYPGVFRVGLQTKSENMSKAIDALEEEVHGIIDNPPDDDEITKAKDSILNSFVFNYDSAAKVLNQQLRYAYYGLPADFLEQYRANIEKVGTDDVARVAKKYIHPDRMSILVVGKNEDFDKPIDEIGQVAKLDITIPPPPGAPRVEATAVASKEGAGLISKMASAMLGDNGSIQGFRSAGSVEVTQPMAMSMKQQSVVMFPDKFRQESEAPFGKILMVFDGTDGMMIMPQGSQPIPDSMKGEITKQISMNPLFLAAKAREGDENLKVVSAGTEEVNGVECAVIQVDYGEHTLRLHLDPETHLPMKESFQGQVMGQGIASIEVYFEEWRDVDGIKIPYKTNMKADGKDAQTATTEEFEINPEVDENTFQEPST